MKVATIKLVGEISKFELYNENDQYLINNVHKHAYIDIKLTKLKWCL